MNDVTLGVTERNQICWGTSNTVLIYKKNDPFILDNYRPIALAPVLYKLWSNCLTLLLTNYVESRKILSSEQEGFRASNPASVRSFTSYYVLKTPTAIKKIYTCVTLTSKGHTLPLITLS